MSSARLSCRMYENRYPEVDDIVMVNVRQIADMGAYVKLLEYNDIEGMILLSELSRRRIRSIQKLIRVGRNEVVVVLRVDKTKGYIDLSKRRVTAEDIQKCEEKFNKSKTVHSIMRHVSDSCNVNMEDLYTNFGWPLYKKYGHAYDAFKLAISDPEKVFEGIEIDERQKSVLMQDISHRLTPQPIKIRADIDVTCYGYDGIDAIKAALTAGEACQTAQVGIKIKLVAPPLYVMITQSLDKVLGIETLNKAIEVTQQKIRELGGDLVVKMKPRAVSETDETELAALMERMEKENTEVGGDDDHDEDDDGDDDAAAAGAGSSKAQKEDDGEEGEGDEDDEQDDA